MKVRSIERSILFFLHFLFLVQYSGIANAQETHRSFIYNAWASLSKKDYKKALEFTDKCIHKFEKEAISQQASLSSFPSPQIEGPYDILNCVGVAYFIRGKAFIGLGEKEKAKESFLKVINQFGFSQWWDPKGWFWKVAEEAKRELDKLEGRKSETLSPAREKEIENKRLSLAFPGTEFPVDYEKYGRFVNEGTDKYRYEIKDRKGLSLAVGEGIYPNNSVFFDPMFEKLKKSGRLEGSQWDFVNTADTVANFYKWATVGEEPGVALFYTALSLERAGLVKEAIKAYYAIIVHFPNSIGWTYWQTPWYPAKVAVYKIRYLCRKHPELNVELRGARIKILNGFDKDVRNDIFIVNPGRLQIKELNLEKKGEEKKVVRTRGGRYVRLVQYANRHWQLLVEDKPYFIRGMNYYPVAVGQSPDDGSLKNWMEEDENNNGLADAPFDSWVDKNRNNKKDEDEQVVGDFRLMQEMGVNTIRVYHHPYKVDKKLLRELYQKYKIMVIMGDFLGAYTIGSGADWYKGTDYSNPEHQRRMLESVKQMVEEFKNEPYVLFWLLGNENNYGLANNASENPRDFYKFVNQAAKLVKQLDPSRPVAICNGDILFLDIFAQECQDVDIFGTNIYRGKEGFGALWEDVRDFVDKPVVITEYGCPAYMRNADEKTAEKKQAEYHQGCWEDIKNNSAFHKGAGNSLGGLVFEWVDEWWKSYNPDEHNTNPNFAGPFPDGWMYEEWLGVCSQGDGKSSPYLRQLRESYYLYQRLWRGGEEKRESE